MTALQFIASLVGSLAWPVVVLVVLVIFRKQVRQLASRPMRRLRAGPLEVEFDRLLSEVEVSVTTPSDAVQSASSEDVALARLATTSPAAAVMDAHSLVEKELRDIVRTAVPEAGVSRMAIGQLLRLAVDRKAITPETAKAVEGVTVMRNLAAHGRASEITVERAQDYLALVDAVLYALRQRPAA